MFKEYEVIVASLDIDSNIKKGFKGTVLIVYDTSNFEVEFFNDDESPGTKTVSID